MAKYNEWLTEDGLLLLEAWARDGLTDEDIADNMGIGVRTLYEWKKKFPQISQALKKGKKVVDIKVENALLKKALGLEVKKTVRELQLNPQTGEQEWVVTKEISNEIPPDPVALIYWLKNRLSDKWRDKPVDNADAGNSEAHNELVRAIKEAVRDED